MAKPLNIFITGSSGYIAGMLVERLLEDSNIVHITALDMRPPLDISGNGKVSYITWNLGDAGWEEKVLKNGVPDVVIHCAYVIRQGYGKKRDWQIKSNITAAERLFEFVFKNKIPRFIHFSTVAVYGARPENSVSKKFTETDALKESEYLYGVDKKIIEEKLQNMFQVSSFKSQLCVVRPCAVTGPRGQFIFKRFGLLQMVKYGLPFVPVTGPEAARQYVHEDDVWEAVKLMVFGNINGEYDVFNLAPQDFLLLKDMARSVRKIPVRTPMLLGKLVFALLWHLSRGRVPTVPASINSYTYPIIVDGSKITRHGFSYKHSAKDALGAKSGYYSRFIPNRA